MPWNNQGGGWQGGGGGPLGQGPWGKGSGRGGGGGGGGTPPDLEEIIRKAQERLKAMFGGGGGMPSPHVWLVGVVAIAAIFAYNSFYQVNPTSAASC
jgi:modulator of FtsH protease HflK